MAATQTQKEMRRYLKIDEVETRTIQIEDLEEIVVNAFKDIGEDDDEIAKVIETKKQRCYNTNLAGTSNTSTSITSSIFLESSFEDGGKIYLPS